MKFFPKLFIFAFLVPKVTFCQPSDPKITANNVIDQIKKHVSCAWMNQTVDTFKSGNPDDEVTGIVACMFADMKILKEAVDKKCNLIIVHEPVFYNHRDEINGLRNSEVLKEKQKYIADHKLIIFRFHDHIHLTYPDGICAGMVEELGWEDNMFDTSYLYFKFEEQTLSEFVEKLSAKLKTREIRVVGDKNMKFTKVSLSVGASGSQAHFRQLQDERTEVLVAGEAQEWETYQYVNDAVLQGKKMAAIFLGHIPSEEAGMKYCAKWLGGFIKDIPVIFLKNDPLYWSPN